MRNLLELFIRNGGFVTFLILEVLCFALIVNYNTTQKTIFTHTTGQITGNINAATYSVSQFFGLANRADSLHAENARLSAELYALLSALSGAPIRQSVAVTGSVNQKGEIQAVGGINEKIEGFFEVCRAGGLTGAQGVLIPHSNTRNLMLREDIREAVLAGKFHIYTARTIEEGIEILTGLPAGKPTADSHGRFEKGSVFDLVNRRLQDYERILQEHRGGFPAAHRRPSRR